MQHRQERKNDRGFTNRGKSLRLPPNAIIIALSYLESGINLIIAGFNLNKNAEDTHSKHLVVVGVIMLAMVFISILDNRKEMRGKFAVVSSCIAHLAFCGMLTFFYSFWWMCIYVIEVLFCVCIIIITKTLDKKQNRR